MAETRPLISLDLETTGADPATARIVEIALVESRPHGAVVLLSRRVNPGCPIPAEATAVHGISEADVASCAPFEEIATEVGAHLLGADLVGYNLRAFDLPILRREFEAAGVAWPCEEANVIDPMVVFREHWAFSLANAVRFYLGREHTGAHGAKADAIATLDVLHAQLSRHDLPTDPAELALHAGGRRPDWATECGRLRWNADGELTLAFSKHAGRRLVDVDRGFCTWILKGDFAADVKELARQVLAGAAPRRPT